MRTARTLLVVASLLLTAVAVAPMASAHKVCGRFSCCGLEPSGEPGSPQALADAGSHAICFPIENAPGIIERVGDLVDCIVTGNC